MAGTVYGYVRVSSKDQNEARQLQAMQQFGIPRSRVFVDKQSGKDFNRPQYLRLMRRLRRGDVLVVKSIDRLGRNYEEILAQWRAITEARRAAIVVLDMPLLDTRRDRDLAGTLIADIVLQLLSYVAQVEREFIRKRQAEGIAIARQRGVRFGRRAMERPADYAACNAAYRNGTLSSREAGRRLGVSHTCFLNWVRADISAEKMVK